MTLPWVEKYTPKALDGFFGEHIKEFVKALGKFKRGKAVLIVGPTGSGKSSSVHAYAKGHGLDVIELNASDFRNADAIESVAGAAIRQHSLFGRGKIILIDEVDGVAGREDRGGVQVIAKIIDESIFPIVITANDVSDQKFKTIRKKSVMVKYVPLGFSDMVALMTEIVKREHVAIEDDALRHLARISEGDVRAAINDLQCLSGLEKVTREDVATLGFRERKERIGQALLKVLKTKDPKVSLSSFDNLDEDLDEIFLWMEENLPLEYTKPADVARGFMRIAEADVFRGRIRRWQYYRFMVYCYALLSAGVSLAKDEKYTEMHEYKQTSRLLKIWIYNQKLAKKRALAKKMKGKLHASAKRIFREDLQFMRQMAKNKVMAKDIAVFFRLDKEEVEALAK